MYIHLEQLWIMLSIKTNILSHPPRVHWVEKQMLGCFKSRILYWCSVSYVAEYKEARQGWEEARKRYWFQEAGGSFELGNLEPWTSYNIRSEWTHKLTEVRVLFRFGCANDVGISPWGEELQITLPKPGSVNTRCRWRCLNLYSRRPRYPGRLHQRGGVSVRQV